MAADRRRSPGWRLDRVSQAVLLRSFCGAVMVVPRILRLFELPLLAKELNEQAAQKRTYLIRFAYASVLFTVTCGLFYGNSLHRDGSLSGGLGQGRRMFEELVW